MSFHATKVFNTFEGGAIISPDAKTKQRIDHLKNFGFVDEVTVVAPGINGKMSEIHAAFGLLQLKHIDAALSQRERIGARYRAQLAQVPGIRCANAPPGAVTNNAYFPIMVTPEFAIGRDQLFTKLRENNIHARRYFYPLISDFPMYRSMPSSAPSNLPVARTTADQVICLPIYPTLEDAQVDAICRLIAASGNTVTGAAAA